MKLSIDCYELTIKVVVRKDYWDADNNFMNAKIVKEKIEIGLEIPLESVDVVVK